MSEKKVEELFRQALSPRPSCPSEETIAGYLNGSLPAGAMDEVRAHLDACPRCEAHVRLLSAFETALAGPAEAHEVELIVERMRPRPALRPDVPAFLRRWAALPSVPKWALAASIVLAVAAGMLHLRSVWKPMIHPGEAGVLRSSAVRLQSPSGDLAEAPKVFRWEPVSGAARYEVVVSEVDGSELVRVQATGTAAPAPASVASAPPLKTLMWKVVAHDAAGQLLGESQWVRFRVVPPGP